MNKILEQRFWNVASEAVSRLPFKEGCEQHVRHFIQDGIRRMESEGLSKNEAKILEAEHNLTRFVVAMVYEARRQGRQDLGETTYDAARSGLCPTWPFC